MNLARSRTDHVPEIRHALSDPLDVCTKLGLASNRANFQRQSGRGVTIRCPWHDEKSPSCSVTVGPDGTIRVRCFGCDQTGDVFTLVAAVLGLSAARDFRRVLVECASLAGLHGVVHELETGAPADRPVFVPRRAEPPSEPSYPPNSELEALLAECVPVTDCADVSAYLTTRGIDPELVAESNLALALKPGCRLPGRAWAFQGLSWVDGGYRLILPVRDSLGAIRSVRAWRITDGDTPKRLPPGGYRATGLALACPMATAMFTSTHVPVRLLIAEGEGDFLSAATWPMREPTAVMGIFSGSWTPAFAAKVPRGCRVFVWTDRDRAGDRYAEAITTSLAPRGVRVERWKGAT